MIVQMWESMTAVLLLLPVLLQTALAFADPSTCVFPKFSHNDKDALVWLERRITGDWVKSKGTRSTVNWSKYAKRKHFAVSGTTSWDEFEQYLTWLHEVDRVKSRKFFLKETKQFNSKTQGVSNGKIYEPLAVASMDLQEKEVLLELPLHYCISDQVSAESLWSLNEAPWELRLAVKLLQSRPKSEGSTWYAFIRILPTIRLPLFFSESELQNVEDASIINEVLSMRSFALSSFHALYQHEITSSSFDDFVWALAVVYSFACRLDGSNGGIGAPVSSTHLLIPFISSYNSSLEAKAAVELHGQGLKIVMSQDAAEGSPLSLNYFASTSRDNFLYRGFVPISCPHDKARVFESLQDLVEWYLSTFGKREDKRASLMLVDDAMQRFGYQLNRANSEGARISSPDFSVGLDGYFDPYMIFALTAVSNSNQKLQGGTEVLESFDVTFEGSSCSKELTIGSNSSMLSKFGGSVCRVRNSPLIDERNKCVSHYANLALKRRICTILNSLSTTLEEDEALLKASMWEGFSDDDGGSHLCQTCQWQTEELSFNDFLALQYRIRKKHVLLCVLSTLSHDCFANEDEHLKVKELEDTSYDVHAKAVEEFLKWCEKEGAQITEALAVTNILEISSLIDSSTVVRGVEAVRDIEQGETICILPLNLGLFDKSSSHSAGADSWHLASAHLLREKSLGLTSKWASYISILPKSMQTPIYLMPHELHEVQWWPVLRELIQVRRAIRTSFSQLAGQELLAGADFEQYRWAVTMVHSRAFTLPVENEDEYASYVLMPFMDIINHHFKYQADWMSLPVKDGKLEIIAKRHIDKGQQIFASFGPRSNDNLFLYYGFVLENNPFDSAQVFSSFEDAVHWLVTSWSTNCDESRGAMVTEGCTHKVKEQMWAKAQKAIDDYAAGVTEQRPEWWKLVNTWADYGYEYMQFQPSPSVYAGGIIDPTLYVALEAVLGALLFDKEIALKGCTQGESNLMIDKYNLNAFFMCLDDIPWRSASWALHSSLCSDYACRALASLSDTSRIKAMVKISMSLRCLDILNSFPTTILEDKHLLKQGNQTNSHVQLARQYRYMKKMFLMDFIRHLAEED